jgi:hypothetical protein
MSPALRKLTLAVHIAVSVGWVGAVAAYIALDVTAFASQDPATLRGAYLGMDLIVRLAIVPLAIAALLTGLVVALGTPWGLFHHWWVVISLGLTIVATIVLLIETRTIAHHASVAADPLATSGELAALGSTIVHSVGGILVLLLVLVLNVLKPSGLTPYGWRKKMERRAAARALKPGDVR